MSKYFINYPIIEYQGKRARDLSRRSKVRDDILQDPYLFLPYTVREGENPETIADLYYGSVDDTWLVLFANNITDPYFQWPLNDAEFNDFFVDKYAEVSGKTGFAVVRWGQDNTRTDNIIYRYIKSPDTNRIIRVSPETENAIPVRVYEFEQQANENKRNITLIDKTYRNQIVQEFKRSLRI